MATSTVADLERGQRTPVSNNTPAIRGALEGAGIRFLPTGVVIGPAVPGITPSEHPGTPIRWVSAADLSSWADRADSTSSLPTLLFGPCSVLTRREFSEPNTLPACFGRWNP